MRTFQKDTEFRTLSARDNVLIGTYCRPDMNRAHRARAIDRALDRVELDTEHRTRLAGDLSIFDKKRLMIASALVGEPKLLLLDEPASGLTKPEIEQLRTLILGLNQSGMTIIVIEHVLTLLAAVANRLIVLNEGRVLTEGAPTAVVRNERVISAYLGGKAHHAASYLRSRISRRVTALSRCCAASRSTSRAAKMSDSSGQTVMARPPSLKRSPA